MADAITDILTMEVTKRSRLNKLVVYLHLSVFVVTLLAVAYTFVKTKSSLDTDSLLWLKLVVVLFFLTEQIHFWYIQHRLWGIQTFMDRYEFEQALVEIRKI
jgi:hypothetical protein